MFSIFRNQKQKMIFYCQTFPNKQFHFFLLIHYIVDIFNIFFNTLFKNIYKMSLPFFFFFNINILFIQYWKMILALYFSFYLHYLNLKKIIIISVRYFQLHSDFQTHQPKRIFKQRLPKKPTTINTLLERALHALYIKTIDFMPIGNCLGS